MAQLIEGQGTQHFSAAESVVVECARCGCRNRIPVDATKSYRCGNCKTPFVADGTIRNSRFPLQQSIPPKSENGLCSDTLRRAAGLLLRQSVIWCCVRDCVCNRAGNPLGSGRRRPNLGVASTTHPEICCAFAFVDLVGHAEHDLSLLSFQHR